MICFGVFTGFPACDAFFEIFISYLLSFQLVGYNEKNFSLFFFCVFSASGKAIDSSLVMCSGRLGSNSEWAPSKRARYYLRLSSFKHQHGLFTSVGGFCGLRST